MTLKKLSAAARIFYGRHKRLLRQYWVLDGMVENELNRAKLLEARTHIYKSKELMDQILEPELGRLIRKELGR